MLVKGAPGIMTSSDNYSWIVWWYFNRNVNKITSDWRHGCWCSGSLYTMSSAAMLTIHNNLGSFHEKRFWLHMSLQFFKNKENLEWSSSWRVKFIVYSNLDYVFAQVENNNNNKNKSQLWVIVPLCRALPDHRWNNIAGNYLMGFQHFPCPLGLGVHPLKGMGMTQIAKFMQPTWGPPGSCRPQMGPM